MFAQQDQFQLHLFQHPQSDVMAAVNLTASRQAASPAVANSLAMQPAHGPGMLAASVGFLQTPLWLFMLSLNTYPPLRASGEGF